MKAITIGLILTLSQFAHGRHTRSVCEVIFHPDLKITFSHREIYDMFFQEYQNTENATRFRDLTTKRISNTGPLFAFEDFSKGDHDEPHEIGSFT